MNNSNLRIQDLIGALCGVQLKQTVKVLRTLSLVLRHQGEEKLAEELDELLIDSAIMGEYVAPLHSRPEPANFEAANDVRRDMLADEGTATAVARIRDLTRDPYADRNITEDNAA